MKKAILTTVLLASLSFGGTVTSVYSHLNKIGHTDAQVSEHLAEFKYLSASEQTMMVQLKTLGVSCKDALVLIEKKRTAEKKASKK